MHHEIERKFLVKKMPNMKGIEKVSQERYFIQRSDLVEEGMKKKGAVYLYEKKFSVTPHEKSREKKVVSKEEFDRFKSRGTNSIERDSYGLWEYDKPIVSIKKYKGIYHGLVLAEVEFDDTNEMEEFKPFSWMGAEVTDTKIGKDARLVDLDREHFIQELRRIEDNFKGVDGESL